MPVMIAVSIGLHLAILGGAGGWFISPRHLPFSGIRDTDVLIPEAIASSLPEITVLGQLQQIPRQPEQVLPPEEPALPPDNSAALVVPPDVQSRREIRSNDPEQTAMLRYQDTVKQRIQQCRSYPAAARQQHCEGTVEVVFTINRGGAAGGIAVLRSAGSKLLDAEAVATVKRAAPFLPIPPDISVNSVTMRIAVVFSLS